MRILSARAAPVKFMFQRKGRISIPLDTVKDEPAFLDKLVEVALEAGADDFDIVDDELLVSLFSALFKRRQLVTDNSMSSLLVRRKGWQ